LLALCLATLPKLAFAADSTVSSFGSTIGGSSAGGVQTSQSNESAAMNSQAAAPLDLYRNKYSAEGQEDYLTGKPHTIGDALDLYKGSLPPLILGNDAPYLGPPLVEHYALEPRTTNYSKVQDTAAKSMSGFSNFVKQPNNLYGAAEVINPFSQYSSAFNVTSGTSSTSVGAAPGMASTDMNPGFPNYSQFGGGVRRLYP